MPTRTYLVPAVSMPPGHPAGFAPKYFFDGTLTLRKFSARDYGKGDLFLVTTDTDDTEHALLVSMSDVVPFDHTRETVDPALLTALSARGFPVGGFNGTTEAALLGHLQRVISVKQARYGVDAQIARLNADVAALDAVSKASVDGAAYVAAHAVVVTPIPDKVRP